MLRIRNNKEKVKKFTPPFTACKVEASPPLPLLLIVDDDMQILRVCRRLLKNMFCIETASNAYDASVLLSKYRFEAILTDFDMPGEDGLRLLRRVRRTHPLIRRVLFSGSSPEELSESILSGLVHAFVPKPAGREELVAALRWNSANSLN